MDYKTEKNGITAYKMFIDNEWVNAVDGKVLEVENPCNEEVFATVPAGKDEDAQRALESSAAAQKEWAKLPPKKRAEILQNFTAEIKKNRELLAALITKEQGKTIATSYLEVDATCTYIEYACEQARRIEGDIVPSDNPNEQIWIQKVPVGVTVGITSWNFPLALAGRKLGPALVAGNSMVIKPTTETPLATLELGVIAKKAGIPKGVLNIVTGSGRVLGEALVSNPITRLVTMTGSTYAGQQIFKTAAGNMTNVGLELGGKAPFIVMDDVDIDKAVDAAFTARFFNNAQVCTCNERMYLHEKIYDKFMEKFLAKVDAIKIGDPNDPATDMGPKVNKSEFENMERFVQACKDEGATITRGGGRVPGAEFEKGYWFAPTIVTDVKQDMTVVQEEVFGPILPVLKFSSFDEVVGLANDSQYGLSAYIWTNDMNRIMRCVNDFEFGEFYINTSIGEQHQGFHGGMKQSGIGGEDGKYGFEFYLQKKTFYVNYNG